MSKPQAYAAACLPQGSILPGDRESFLEGNAAVDSQGRLLNILRYHVSPHFTTSIALNISPDGKRLFFDRIINVFGGMTEFTIRRHPKTSVHGSLVRLVTRPEKVAMRGVPTLIGFSRAKTSFSFPGWSTATRTTFTMPTT